MKHIAAKTMKSGQRSICKTVISVVLLCTNVIRAGSSAEAIDALTGQSERARKDAVRSLLKDGSAAVPALIEALKNDNAAVRTQAMLVLGRMGPTAKDAFAVLEQALVDPDPQVAHTAAMALASIDRQAAVWALEKVLHDPQDFSSVWSGFQVVGPDAVSILVDGLNHSNKTVRLNAARTLSAMGPMAADAVPTLVIALKDPDSQVRKEAVYAIRRMESCGVEAIGAIQEVLRDSDKDVRAAAAWALDMAQGTPEAKVAVPILLDCLHDEDSTVRRAALFALGVLGPDARQAAWMVSKYVNDEDKKIREQAIQTLGKIDPDTPDTITVLEEGLFDPQIAGDCFDSLYKTTADPNEYISTLLNTVSGKDKRTFWFSILRLGQAGPKAAVAVPYLRPFLRDRVDEFERVCALKVLGDIGPPATVAAADIEYNLKNPYDILGQGAIHIWTHYALANIGMNLESHLEALVGYLNREDKCNSFREKAPWSGTSLGWQRLMKSEACKALGRLGPPAKSAVPRLTRTILEDDDLQTRVEAIMALGAIGPDAVAAIPALVEVINTSFGAERWRACVVLGKIGRNPELSLPVLIRTLGARDQTERSIAAQALFQFGSKAVALLTRAQADPNPLISFNATIVLEEIDKRK